MTVCPQVQGGGGRLPGEERGMEQDCAGGQGQGGPGQEAAHPGHRIQRCRWHQSEVWHRNRKGLLLQLNKICFFNKKTMPVEPGGKYETASVSLKKKCTGINQHL